MSLKTNIFRVIVASFMAAFPLFVPASVYAQAAPDRDSTHTIMVAGKQYATSAKHQKRWGKHYRKEWITPVRIPYAYLDTLAGGVVPYQAGGGRQSKTLRLHDSKNREYVLRSIDKTFGEALPPIAQGTFIESIANDQVSIGHPYSAVTVPPMAEAAGIYHTRPRIYFIPKQKGLLEFNEEYGDRLYLFEQRPDENWAEADNFGNAENLISTDKLIAKILEDDDRQVDQKAFVRARLFDLLIGDWGRHEDQWRWAEFKNGEKRIYKPVPRDRDQVYTKFDGSFVTLLFSMAGFEHLQSFEPTISDVNTYNFPARNLDRFMANEVTVDEWINIAKDLQKRLTDTVLSNAIRQMPPEVFPISGEEIIAKLKSRRDHLHEYAAQYAGFLAHDVDIPGSSKREHFEVNRKDNTTVVTISHIKKDGSLAKEPFYSREFRNDETEEIRLYGLGEDDVFLINGSASKGILLRLVPGGGKDSVIDNSKVNGSKRLTHIYDNQKPGLSSAGETKLHVTNVEPLNNYEYASFQYDKKGFVIRPGMTIGLGYHIKKRKWRKEPFGHEHRVMGYYGPNRGSVAFEYRYIANQAIGQWNLQGIARADIPFVANFYGIGNETTMQEQFTRKFYRFRRMVYTAGMEINRLFDSTHLVTFSGSFQRVQLRNEPDRFVAKEIAGLPVTAMDPKYFASAGVAYQFKKANDPVIPSKGIEFNGSAAYTKDLHKAGNSFATYASSFSFYLPFLNKLSLAVRVGGIAVSGEPEFYQLATLGGKENLRGYRRQRFYGKTAAYNNNELRWITNVKGHLFNGKIGLLAFVDQGRVWYPGEDSDLWHVGYGGGFFVSPFNKILLNASYGLSKEDQVIHFRVGFFF